MGKFDQTWQQSSLSSPSTYQSLIEKVGEIIKFDLEEEAYNLVRLLEKDLSESKLKLENSELFFQYNNLILRLKWIALPLLTDKEVVDLFGKNLIEAWLLPGYNLWDKLRSKLIGILVYEERDKLKLAIRDALIGSEERVALSTGEESTFTIGELFKNYNQELGMRPIDKMKQTQFLVGSDLLKKMSPLFRGQIHQLLNLYEFCKLSSLTLEGLEETIPMDGLNPGVVRGGQFEAFDKSKAEKVISEAITISTKPISELAPKIVLLTPSILQVSKAPEPLVTTPTTPQPLKNINLVKSALSSPISIPLVPQVLKTTEPAFFFNLEDEKEIDKLRIPNTELRIMNTLEEKLRALAEEVIKKHNFSFKDETGKRRFINLFVSRLKDVRDVVEVREALLRSIELGGLGLPIDKTEQVIKIIEDAKSEFESKIPALPAGRKNQESAQVADSKPQTEQEKMQSELDKLMRGDVPIVINPVVKPIGPQVVLPKSDKIGELNSNDNAQTLNQTQSPNVKIGVKPLSEDKFKNWREEMLKEIAKAAPPPPVKLTAVDHGAQPPSPPKLGISGQEPETNNIRPQLMDIKAPPRTLGPLEELKSLNLVDFRRLDSSPVEALSKVRAKIDLIGETSVSRRLEAVRSWQASPVYQLYLKLGRVSIEQEKSIAEAVANLQARGEQTLSEAEFNAIIDFNQKIRF